MNAVLDALAEVDDPEYPGVSIVDLGLVERVEISGRSVEVDLVPTFSGCPALEMIATDVAATVGALDSVDDVRVRFVRTPAWTPARISAAARDRLASRFGVAVSVGTDRICCPLLRRRYGRGVAVRPGALPFDPSLHGVRRDRRDRPMRIYEVFLKRDGKDEFRHAGSLEAADDELAVVLARETYVRRAEGDQLWLVDRRHVVTVEPEFLTPNADKPHRHNDGHLVADRRRAQRA